MVKYVYHYTDTKGLEGILKSNKIKKSIQFDNDDDAIFGEGVYFTACPPETSTESLLMNNYQRDGSSMKDKVQWYIRIDVAKCPVLIKKMESGQRDVYKCQGDLVLDRKWFTTGKRFD